MSTTYIIIVYSIFQLVGRAVGVVPDFLVRNICALIVSMRRAANARQNQHILHADLFGAIVWTPENRYDSKINIIIRPLACYTLHVKKLKLLYVAITDVFKFY